MLHDTANVWVADLLAVCICMKHRLIMAYDAGD